MTQPFAGMTVIDMTHVVAGPFSTYQLAVLGASVIKVEHPAEPDQVRHTGTDRDLARELMGTNYLTQASNKASLTVDIKTAEGREIIRKLARTADVFVENYRTGALGELGLGYEDLSADNPGLIYCSLTGFGQEGPKAAHNAYDMIIQAASGLMSVSGTPEVTPIKVGAPIVDYASGAMAAFALASALLQRERNGGRGQYIDMAMQDAALMLLSSNVAGYTVNGKMLSVPRGNDFSIANGSCYPTRDGTLLMLGAVNARQHERLWTLLGREDVAAKSSHEEVVAMEGELRPELERRLLERTADEWEALLNEAGVPAARVRTIPEALALEQVGHRPALLHKHSGIGPDGITVPVAAFNFAHGGPRITTPPPRMGQHTEEILGRLGYSGEQVAALAAAGVIGLDTPPAR